MKKILSLLLCLILTLSLLASCNNDKSSTSSENSETSESSEVSQEIQIPEKVVYFTGDYETYDYEYREKILDKLHLRELGSCNSGSLDEYFSLNNPSDDTYFLVRVSYDNGVWNPDDSEIESANRVREATLDFLKNYDYIDIQNHPWISTGEFMKVINDCSDTEGQNLLVLDELKKMFPDVDPALIETACENGNFEIVAYMGFPAIGYISAGALKDMAELTLPDTHSLTVTWFPAPDDQERWLTIG